jgi:hypothetical protein
MKGLQGKRQVIRTKREPQRRTIRLPYIQKEKANTRMKRNENLCPSNRQRGFAVQVGIHYFMMHSKLLVLMKFDKK